MKKPEPFPVGLGVAFYAGVAAVAVAWRLLADDVLPLRPAHPPEPDAPSWTLQLFLGLGVGMLLILASRLWTRFGPGGDRLAEALAQAVGGLSPAQAWLLALASGIAEEAFFRGALQPQVGLVWASLLFGAAHFVPRPGLRGWAVYAALAGLLFGVLFEQLGSLLAPAAAHVVVNGINLSWLARRSAGTV